MVIRVIRELANVRQDIKPENTLLDLATDIKLANFAFATNRS